MSPEPVWDGKTERRRKDVYQIELLTKVTALSVELDKVVRFIEGNGNYEKGAIVRLDRVEENLREAKKVHDRRSLWMWGSIGGLGLKAIWDFLFKSK